MRALPPNHSYLTWSPIQSETCFIKAQSLIVNSNNPSPSWPHHLHSILKSQVANTSRAGFIMKIHCWYLSGMRNWCALGLGVAFQLEFNQTNLLGRPGNAISKCCGERRKWVWKWARFLCCMTWPVFFLLLNHSPPNFFFLRYNWHNNLIFVSGR